MTTDLVFVYGTLKAGKPNHHLLAGARLWMIGKTAKRFRMYCNGYFPMITLDREGYPIRGEVYQVTPQILERLDRLEGVPHHYYRDSVTVVNANWNRCVAYVYVHAGLITDQTEVPSGNWTGE